MSSTPSDEITAAEAATILGTVEETAHNYRRRGILSAREERRGFRSRFWFRRSEVEALARRLATEQR